MSETVVVPRDVLQVAIASLRAAAENTTSRNDRAAYNATAAMMEAAAPSPAEGERLAALERVEDGFYATTGSADQDMAIVLNLAREALATPSPSALRVAQEAVLDEETLLDAAHILLSCGGPGWDHVQEEAAHRIGQRMIEAAERTLAPAAISSQGDELERLRTLVNSPELHDFSRGVVLEAGHQRERWGNDHDAGKEPADWFWLVGYLAGKALNAHKDGNTDKALHHTISTAAALANWHGAILGTTNMRPGIDGEAAVAAAIGGGA